MTETGRLLVTGSIALIGVASSVWLWRQAPRNGKPWGGNELLRGDRPWRRLGAAMVGFVGVMFFAGTNFLDAKASPRDYVLFWFVLLLLILWMCILALVDTFHTLKLRSQQRRRRRQPGQTSATQPGRE